MVIGEDDNIVLDSYRLARFYRQSPDVFLSMPLSEVRVHMERTIQLSRLLRSESADED